MDKKYTPEGKSFILISVPVKLLIPNSKSRKVVMIKFLTIKNIVFEKLNLHLKYTKNISF